MLKRAPVTTPEVMVLAILVKIGYLGEDTGYITGYIGEDTGHLSAS